MESHPSSPVNPGPFPASFTLRMSSTHTGESHDLEVSPYFVETCMPRKLADITAGLDTGGSVIDIPFYASHAVTVMKVIIYSVDEQHRLGKKPHRILGTFCINMDAEIPYYWGSAAKWFWFGKILHYFHHEFGLDTNVIVEHADLMYWENSITSNTRYKLHASWWLLGPAARYLGRIGLEGVIAEALVSWGEYLEPGKTDNWVVQKGTFGQLGFREVSRKDWPIPDDPVIIEFLRDVWPHGEWE